MRRGISILATIVGLGLIGPACASVPPPRSGAPPAPSEAVDRARAAYGRLPLAFEPNVGQAVAPAGFVARAGGYRLTVAPTRAALLPSTSDRPTVALDLIGADAAALPEGQQALPGRVNYLVGEPSRHRTDLPKFARAAYRGVYPGIDVIYYGSGPDVEYDFVVAPGADPGQIRLSFSGVDGLRLDSDGDLLMAVGRSELVQRAPVAYQEVGGRRLPIEAGYRLDGSGHVRLRLGAYDRGLTLVVDPVIVYSTFLGGGGQDSPYDVEVDSSGSAYLTGFTLSTNFPTVNPLQGPRGYDAIVAKLNPAGSALVYSTYLGGGSEDYATSIDLDGSGSAYVTGTTRSPDFPSTSGAAQPAHSGGSDAFVAKLDPTGSDLVYSTFLGGIADDGGEGLAVDASGSAYVGGTTRSVNFPTRTPLQFTMAGESDAFVAKLNPSGSGLVYSTYLGGSGEDGANDLDIDGAGNAVITGEAESVNFPTLNAVQGSRRGYSDVIVAKLSPTGSALVYSTYLGGTGYATPSYYSREFGLAIAADAAGNAYVTGLTESTDFPVVNALFPVSGNGYDAFITKLAPTGPLVYSTYLGSAGSERGDDIEVDAAGSVYITGNVAGPVPLKDPIQEPVGQHDAFVTKLNPAGTALEFSTMLGGSGQDHGQGVAVDAAGAIYVVGETEPGVAPTAFFPLKDPLQPTPGGGFDGFVTKVVLPGSARVTIEGATFFTDGSSARSAAPGTSVSLFANSAATGFAYRVVLARDGCATTVSVLGTAPRFANANGFIGSTRVTIPAATPAGTYELCFKSEGGLAASGSATITIG